LKLVSPYNFSFSEALTQYVITKKNGKKTLEGHQEITRFVAWVGRERTISELTPSEVADYAQHIGLGGSESAQRLSPVKGFLTFLKEQGWVETSLAPHLRIPRSRRTSTSKRSTGADSTSNGAQFSGAQLSQEGYDRLQAQLASLKEERVKVVEDIKRAMEDKDFRENSPLDAAKERQGLVESRIRELESSLTTAQIWSESSRSAERKRVAIGVKVTLKELDTGKLIRYTLVDVREANVSAGKISTASPVGQALLDRKVGDKVSVNVPKGTLLYSIEEIGA
jgi:transcription elongation factor GreA